MLKYRAVSAAAKAFSLNDGTKRLYRRLGNRALSRIRLRSGLDPRYVERARSLVETCEHHGMLPAGSRVLELGTGWLHWEATVLRLFYDVEVTLYDVWDGRLLDVYRAWLGQFARHIDETFDFLTPDRRAAAVALAERALAARTFNELYETMGFRFVIDPAGDLEPLRSERFDLVVSCDVLEHIPEAGIRQYMERMYDVMVPGGWSVHQIDLVDHFHYFDPASSPKEYYRFERAQWERWFESDVQYFNRIQRSDWLDLFSTTGWELVDETTRSGPLDGVVLAPSFRSLSTIDLECMQTVLVHRRPWS